MKWLEGRMAGRQRLWRTRNDRRIMIAIDERSEEVLQSFHVGEILRGREPNVGRTTGRRIRVKIEFESLELSYCLFSPFVRSATESVCARFEDATISLSVQQGAWRKPGAALLTSPSMEDFVLTCIRDWDIPAVERPDER